MIQAKDIMRTAVVTVSPDMTIDELGRLFIEKGISGAPVVDSEGRLVGIVTENDLIRQNKRFHIPTLIRIFDAMIPIETSSAVEREIRTMSASRVSEICSRQVITVETGTSLQDIATIMAEKNVHLLPVMSEGRIVGIIGKMDVIRGSLGEADQRQR